jgi:hypothetical protein
LAVHNYSGGNRYLQYAIDGEMNGDAWIEPVDFSRDTPPASIPAITSCNSTPQPWCKKDTYPSLSTRAGGK